MKPRKTTMKYGIIVGLITGVVISLVVLTVSHLTREQSPCDEAARSGAELIDTLISSMEVSNEARDLREGIGTDAERLEVRARVIDLMKKVDDDMADYGQTVEKCPVTSNRNI